MIFTPEALAAPDPEAALARALPWVDLVQVRVKLPGNRIGPSPARPLVDWTRRVLALAAELPEGSRPLVTVDDRVDVAAALAAEGVAGVHLGQADCPPDVARGLLGPTALIGWSTGSLAEVDSAASMTVDYLGFGPVAPTVTKGLDRGLGPQLAREAAARSRWPLFAIGGIDAELARALAPGARVAVGAAILDAPDPAAAARELRAALG
ncbi:thiamine phosphate synthase [Engelhardtia mirabilis]|uniref:thiamine phosphate synthase n=1 Tax=Engelhardtia mirabilis TaxID=2528011 RepID=UPI003AF35F50